MRAPTLSVDVECPSCGHETTMDAGMQHSGTLGYHCHKCGKFSQHMVKTGDAWADQHTERWRKERDLWKKIPAEAYVRATQVTRGGTYQFVLNPGEGDDPIECATRDSIEHELVKRYGMSWAQTNATINSALTTPGQKIYFRRLTKISSTEPQPTTEAPGPLYKVGDRVEINGTDAIFLRFATEGFAVVAVPGAGDTEVHITALTDDVSDKLKNLRELIDDPEVDPDTKQRAQKEFMRLKRSAEDAGIALDKQAYWYKHPWEHEYIDLPDRQVDTSTPKHEDQVAGQSELYPRTSKEYEKNPSRDKNVDPDKKAKHPIVDDQRKAYSIAATLVKNEFGSSGDLKAAISKHYRRLTVADIRRVIGFYRSIGKIGRDEADHLAHWFIGENLRTAAKEGRCSECGTIVGTHGGKVEAHENPAGYRCVGSNKPTLPVEFSGEGWSRQKSKEAAKHPSGCECGFCVKMREKKPPKKEGAAAEARCPKCGETIAVRGGRIAVHDGPGGIRCTGSKEPVPDRTAAEHSPDDMVKCLNCRKEVRYGDALGAPSSTGVPSPGEVCSKDCWSEFQRKQHSHEASTHTAKITGSPGSYYVKSEKGKNLGGPYKTKGEAEKRLRQVEYFKHQGAYGRKKTVQEFIEEHRAELVAAILRVCPNCPVGDDDLEEWIANDDGLWNWALQENVDVYDEGDEEEVEGSTAPGASREPPITGSSHDRVLSKVIETPDGPFCTACQQHLPCNYDDMDRDYEREERRRKRRHRGSSRTAADHQGYFADHLIAPSDANGNPRRLYLVRDHTGKVVAAVDEEYSGEGAMAQAGFKDVPIRTSFSITPRQYREWLRSEYARRSTYANQSTPSPMTVSEPGSSGTSHGGISLSDRHMRRQALLERGLGVFYPALHKGKKVTIIAIDNTGNKATVQDEHGKQYLAPVDELSVPETAGIKRAMDRSAITCKQCGEEVQEGYTHRQDYNREKGFSNCHTVKEGTGVQRGPNTPEGAADPKPCPKCGGMGWITWPGAKGGSGRVTCPRCEGRKTAASKEGPGKFEGEPSYARVLWEMVLDGASDEEVYSGDTPVSIFYTDPELRQQLIAEGADEEEVESTLKDGDAILVYEDTNGFVYADVMVPSELDIFLTELEEGAEMENDDAGDAIEDDDARRRDKDELKEFPPDSD